jgi:hypothetical protein
MNVALLKLNSANATTAVFVSNTANWGAPIQQFTLLQTDNPQYLRTIVISNDGIRLSKGNVAAGFALADIVAALIYQAPTLSWPPIITLQPANANIANGAATAFTVAATAEFSFDPYLWQKSTDNGGNWSNITNAGVYTNATSNHLNISNVTGLSATWYRVTVSAASGNTVSSVAILTTHA